MYEKLPWEDSPWELVEMKKEMITQASHLKKEDDLKPLHNLNSHVQIQTPIKWVPKKLF